MFGVPNSFPDITEGKKAGAKTISAAWGYQPRERLMGAKPDHVAEKPEEILKIFD
ncbi:MAG: hypothetical protein NTV04_10235 [Deltaproteobacteria bacterium]|nr:hypothetical protein [Deltaproteobacteria bacterium]